MTQKPLKPFEVDPKAFILMIESFAKSYPNYWWELQDIAKKAKQEVDKWEFTDEGIEFNGEMLNIKIYTFFGIVT